MLRARCTVWLIGRMSETRTKAGVPGAVAAHHVDVAAGAAGTHVAEVHDADDLLHVVVGPEVGAPACSQDSCLLQAAIWDDRCSSSV